MGRTILHKHNDSIHDLSLRSLQESDISRKSKESNECDAALEEPKGKEKTCKSDSSVAGSDGSVSFPS